MEYWPSQNKCDFIDYSWGSDIGKMIRESWQDIKYLGIRVAPWNSK